MRLSNWEFFSSSCFNSFFFCSNFFSSSWTSMVSYSLELVSSYSSSSRKVLSFLWSLLFFLLLFVMNSDSAAADGFTVSELFLLLKDFWIPVAYYAFRFSLSSIARLLAISFCDFSFSFCCLSFCSLAFLRSALSLPCSLSFSEDCSSLSFSVWRSELIEKSLSSTIWTDFLEPSLSPV